MAIIKKFDLASLESVCEVLGDTANGLTGTQISKYLAECDIYDPQLNSTKRKKLYDALEFKQRNDKCSNNLIHFLQHVMKPSRHVKNPNWFHEIRNQLNFILSFEGLEIEHTGIIKQITASKTLSEAEERALKLKKVLIDRNIHNDVLLFCKAEL